MRDPAFMFYHIASSLINQPQMIDEMSDEN